PLVTYNLSTECENVNTADRAKNKKGQAATTHCKGLKQQTSQLEQNNAYFLEKVRDAEAWSQPGGYLSD
ncbi:hypothetical protein ACUOCP_56305, partial [Escherichia sp. R-CC3]